LIGPTRIRISRRTPAARSAAAGETGWEALESRVFFSAAIPSQLVGIGGAPYGISADGSTVVGESGGEAFRWTAATGLQPLGKFGGDATYATAVSADGSVVTAFADPYGFPPRSKGLRWTAAAGYQSIGNLATDGSGMESVPQAISPDGSVVVGYASTDQSYDRMAFRWTAAGMQGLGRMPGSSRNDGTTGVSADGATIVGTEMMDTAPLTTRGFRWTAATGMQPLDQPIFGSTSTRVNGISADGSTIIGLLRTDDNAEVAVRWTSAGLDVLGDLPGGSLASAHANAVSADGSVIVGIAATADRTTAFIWDAGHGMRALDEVLHDDYGVDVSGWRLASASGVSADGKVICGVDVFGRGWVATLGDPVPPPAASVVGRHLFYNDSVFDGGNPAANSDDDIAIARDKEVLLPGGTASFRNVSTYSKGMNGIMIDVLGLPVSRTPGPDDFEVRVGNTDTPSTWAGGPAPQVSVRRSPIPEAPARVTLTWPAGAMANTWLRVTVKANADTRLAAPDTFYVGSLIGETGDVSPLGVTASDLLRTRLAQGPAAAIDNPSDFNRDGRLNVLDVNACRANQSARLASLGAAPAQAPAILAMRAAPTRRGDLSVTRSILST
jgi:probable HAF family extracellular repeat protein